MLCALKSAGIQIAASILFEGDAKAVGIQLATFSNVAIDRPKSCNEQNLCAYVRRIASASLTGCRSSELRASATTNDHRTKSLGESGSRSCGRGKEMANRSSTSLFQR